MLAFRSLARSVPRATARLSSQTLRQIQPFRIQPASLRASTPFTKFGSPFSSCSRRLQGNEDELIVKLESEIQVEKADEHGEAKTEQREALQNWVKDNGWEIKDVEGEEEVVLTKSSNGETVQITFSIDDINNEPIEEDEAFEEDPALEDEAPLVNQQANPQANPKTIRTAPEDQLETEAEDLAPSEDQLRDPFPAKITINITKQGKPGALVIEGVTQYGAVTFEDIWYFEDGKLSRPTTFESDSKRTKAYAGPPFGTLDSELAQLLEQYLADRGINESLAEFVTEYIEFKESREYQRWLGNIKSFFE